MPRVRLAGALTFISLLVACGGSTTPPAKRAASTGLKIGLLLQHPLDEGAAIEVGANERQAIGAAGTPREAADVTRRRIDPMGSLQLGAQRVELLGVRFVGRPVAHVCARRGKPPVRRERRGPSPDDARRVTRGVEEQDQRPGPIGAGGPEDRRLPRGASHGIAKVRHFAGRALQPFPRASRVNESGYPRCAAGKKPPEGRAAPAPRFPSGRV